jgi:hypothetical protein
MVDFGGASRAEMEGWVAEERVYGELRGAVDTESRLANLSASISIDHKRLLMSVGGRVIRLSSLDYPETQHPTYPASTTVFSATDLGRLEPGLPQLANGTGHVYGIVDEKNPAGPVAELVWQVSGRDMFAERVSCITIF